MHHKRITAYFKGYLILTVEGDFLEKLINLAYNKGIYFFDTRRINSKKMQISLMLEDFDELIHIADKTLCIVETKKEVGIPFTIRKVKGRKSLYLGLIAFITLLYFLSHFIWQIEVVKYSELQHVSEEEVLFKAKEHGLKPGILKGSIDIFEIEKKVSQEMEMLSWVGIDIHGTKCLIKVVEKVVPSPEQLDKRPANIIASKDAVVEEILVLMGVPQVTEGDRVKRGQVLISGFITIPFQGEDEGDIVEESRLVRARGIVRGSVSYEINKNVDLVKRKEISTGNYSESITLVLANTIINISGPKSSPYEIYNKKVDIKELPEIGNFQMPVKLVKTIYNEVIIEEEDVNEESAVEMAVNKAIRDLKETLPEETEILKKNFIVTGYGDERVKVKINIDSYENIGKLEYIE